MIRLRFRKPVAVLVAIGALSLMCTAALAATPLGHLYQRDERTSSHQKSWVITTHETIFSPLTFREGATVTYSHGEELLKAFYGHNPKPNNVQFVTIIKHDRGTYYSADQLLKKVHGKEVSAGECFVRNGSRRQRPLPVKAFNARIALSATALGYRHAKITFTAASGTGDYVWRVANGKGHGTVTIAHGLITRETAIIRHLPYGGANYNSTVTVKYPHTISESAFKLHLRICTKKELNG